MSWSKSFEYVFLSIDLRTRSISVFGFIGLDWSDIGTNTFFVFSKITVIILFRFSKKFLNWSLLKLSTMILLFGPIKLIIMKDTLFKVLLDEDDKLWNFITCYASLCCGCIASVFQLGRIFIILSFAAATSHFI